MKIALTTAIIVLGVAVALLFFEMMRLEDNIKDQIRNGADQYKAAVISERANVLNEFQERYKTEMSKFADTIKELKKITSKK